jgi:hypothetical protein
MLILTFLVTNIIWPFWFILSPSPSAPLPPSFSVLSLFASLIDELDRYDKNPGMIGKMHGDKNEPNPARAESKIGASRVNLHSLSFLMNLP